MKRTLACAWFLAAPLLSAAAPEAPSCNYRVTDLTPLDETEDVELYATAVNNKGVVVGHRDTPRAWPPAGPRAFVYRDGTMHYMDTLGGIVSVATAINDKGRIVGYSSLANGEYHPFSTHGGPLRDLQPDATGQDFLPAGVNAGGQVVGVIGTWVTRHRAFFYERGVLTLIPTLGGSVNGATGNNERGQIVGSSWLDNVRAHAFIYDHGTLTDLGTLGGVESTAMAINESGHVVGESIYGGRMHPFLYRNGIMKNLGLLPGWYACHALALNDETVIVGYCDDGLLSSTALIHGDRQMRDLNSCIDAREGWTLQRATGINRDGQIVGWGLHDGKTRAFLLQPEP